MDFISEKLAEYLSQNSDKEPEILSKLNKETHQKILQPRMLSGHIQGRFLSLISKIKSPLHILEIGTYTGYGTLCLAEGLATNGKIFTIDRNEELINIQNKYFEESGEFNACVFRGHIHGAFTEDPSLLPPISLACKCLCEKVEAKDLS